VVDEAGAVVQDATPPPGVNYAAWLGPAKTIPFNSAVFILIFAGFGTMPGD